LSSAEGELTTFPSQTFIFSMKSFNYNSVSIFINKLIGDINGMYRQD